MIDYSVPMSATSKVISLCLLLKIPLQASFNLIAVWPGIQQVAENQNVMKEPSSQ